MKMKYTLAVEFETPCRLRDIGEEVNYKLAMGIKNALKLDKCLIKYMSLHPTGGALLVHDRDAAKAKDDPQIKRGMWLDGRCTVCGWEVPDNCSYDGYEVETWKLTPYCPCCGTGMDGGDDATVDAVPVVRCKDCKRWDDDPDTYGKDDGPRGKCMKSFETMQADDFCSYGERREGGT